jgi:transposase
MEQLVQRVAGLDVHRDTVVATVRRPRPGGGRAAKTLTFATTTAELTTLGDWLVAEGVELAGMESTGVYWKPVYFLLGADWAHRRHSREHQIRRLVRQLDALGHRVQLTAAV